jgi:type IV pilus assembly protein PilC
MTTYIYKARNANGRLIKGMIEAENEIGAAQAIERLGFSPISVHSQANVSLEQIFGKGFRRITHQEILVFTRQLSTLIATGVPLIQALENVNDQTQNIRFKQVIGGTIDSLKNGLTFSESLSPYPQIFSPLYVSLVKVGEAGGILDKVLIRLAELSTQEIELRSRLTSALVYPAVLAVVAFLIVNFVLVGVLPKFVAIFEASSSNLPLPTKILLSTSNLLRNYWWLLVLIVVFILGWFRRYYHSSSGRFQVDSLIVRLPMFGPFILKVMVSRLARSIAALTKSGIPILEALSVVEPTISNVLLRGVIQNIRTAISQGQSLTEPFKASGLFPPMVIQLINTGEHSGKLDEMFDKIADFYEPEIESTVRNMTSLLEPVMLLVMGGVVAFIALSVLLPIFNLINIIKR